MASIIEALEALGAGIDTAGIIPSRDDFPSTDSEDPKKHGGIFGGISDIIAASKKTPGEMLASEFVRERKEKEKEAKKEKKKEEKETKKEKKEEEKERKKEEKEAKKSGGAQLYSDDYKGDVMQTPNEAINDLSTTTISPAGANMFGHLTTMPEIPELFNKSRTNNEKPTNHTSSLRQSSINVQPVKHNPNNKRLKDIVKKVKKGSLLSDDEYDYLKSYAKLITKK